MVKRAIVQGRRAYIEVASLIEVHYSNKMIVILIFFINALQITSQILKKASRSDSYHNGRTAEQSCDVASRQINTIVINAAHKKEFILKEEEKIEKTKLLLYCSLFGETLQQRQFYRLVLITYKSAKAVGIYNITLNCYSILRIDGKTRVANYLRFCTFKKPQSHPLPSVSFIDSNSIFL